MKRVSILNMGVCMAVHCEVEEEQGMRMNTTKKYSMRVNTLKQISK